MCSLGKHQARGFHTYRDEEMQRTLDKLGRKCNCMVGLRQMNSGRPGLHM